MGFSNNSSKQRTESLKRKQELQMKFKASIGERKTVLSHSQGKGDSEHDVPIGNPSKENMDWGKKNQELKKKNKEEKKKRGEAEAKLTQVQGALHQERLNGKKTKALLLSEKEKNKALEEKMKEMQHLIDKKEEILLQKEKQVQDLLEEVIVCQQIVKNEKTRLNQIKNLKSTNLSLRHQVMKMKEKIRDSDHSFEEKYKKEVLDKQTVLKELKHYKQLAKKESEKPEVHKLIDQLDQYLTMEHVDEYMKEGENPFIVLGKKVRRLQYVKKTLESERETEEEKVLYGHVMQMKGDWIFSDLNYQFYTLDQEVEGYVSADELQSELPAKAVDVGNGKVVIAEQYHSYHKYEAASKEKAKREKRKEAGKSEGYANFGSYKVLVIGSHYQDKYTTRLQKHGLTVVWHDPFSENEKRIEEKAKSADVIIVCTSHVSHSAMEHLRAFKDNPCMQEMEVDNLGSMVARVRYVIVNHLEEKVPEEER